MKAVVYTEYGPPEVMQVKDIPQPTPAKNEVLVQVFASSVNRGDRFVVKGEPFLIRFMYQGIFKPKKTIPGSDIAGIVVALGPDVTCLKVGDEVFADLSESGWGGFAQYVCVSEDLLAKKPKKITYEAAAAVPLSGITALQGIRDTGQVKPGQKVLINGASGSVGTFALQIAKALGAEVTGVCGTKNVENLRSIGADHVIDYTKEDFTQSEERYDMIFDIAASKKLSQCLAILRPKGTYVACAFNPAALFFGPLLSLIHGKQVKAMVAMPNKKDLAFLGDLLETGKVVSLVDKTFDMKNVAQAFYYEEKEKIGGKVVIAIEH